MSRQPSARTVVAALATSALLLSAGSASAQFAPIPVHTPPQQDTGAYSGRLKVPYLTPYELAPEQDVRKHTEGVHASVETAAPVEPIDAATSAPATIAT